MITTPMLQAAAVVAAVAIAAWPAVAAAAQRLADAAKAPAAPQKPSGKPTGPTYQRAMLDLASVRQRLLATEGMSEAVKAAIDTLTLALVGGSDK